ncbi:PTS glucose transporter subunit IIA [Photobacterium gaetbulicola]|uniref:PTS fructose-specific enzyme IIA component-like protein n=1 Tax=Photobacterium gaetbulicola Gung47 TaxID=658445 RepID=A0A0C5WHW8_9GAMM|nr:fructose PTS transporter subunit IIA [Photobacterium gaetbulicola]AJR06733.1 PTS fructose-specific enzyme IIA component-like protein [Photobacterium gaetbulicola Gung47]PSU14052.1 PTS glucose transporter subunit IIA [Photobacterium gaetbulicola]
MKLAQLTSPDLIMLDAVFDDRITAIETLTDKIDQAGKLTDRQMFLDAVLKREEEGPTALGEYLAVPHGKSEAVTEPVFACAFVKDELQWQGLDGDEPVNMIFLLAIPPAEAGSTHMEVLTTLTSSLVDDDFRDQLLAARTQAEVMALFGADEQAAQTGTEPAPNTAANAEPIAAAAMQEPPKEQPHNSKAYPLVLLVGCAIVFLLFAMM